MIDHDLARFSALITGMGEYYRKPLSESAMGIYWDLLKSYDFTAINAAAGKHAQDPEAGRFMPMAADLIKLLPAQKSTDYLPHPGPEEAWAIAFKAAQGEHVPIVWTQQIQDAWGDVAELYAQEGALPARMAFKEIYAGIVDVAKRDGIPAVYHLTEGYGPGAKQSAIDAMSDALRKGLLTADALPDGIKYLAAPQTSATPALEKLAERLALEGPAVEKADDSVIDENMTKIRALLGGFS